MNHIYKVIWNKAKHCYTVVSEIAKSHSQSNKRVRSMTAVVAAAMMLTGFGGMAIEAANPANEDVNIAVGKGASTNTTMGNPPGVVSGYIAIGENAYAWNGGNPNGIGRKESYLDFNQGAVSPSSLFTKAKVTNGTKLAGAIAIGKNTVARTGSLMIGDHTYEGELGDIEVKSSQKMTLNNGVYSTTLGASSYNSGSMSTVTGAFSITSNRGTSTFYDAQNFGATVYGSLNSIESSKSDNLAAGTANSVLGFGNRTQNTNASLVWGTGNEVTNSIEYLKINNPYWHDVSASGAQQQIIDAMRSDQYAGGSVMAIGGGNKADWATYSQLLGVQNTLTGTEKDVSKLTMINGYKNTVANAQNTTIIGSNNKATNIKSTIVMGDENTLEGRQGVISLGNKNTIDADDVVAIGNGATVEAKGGVAIGTSSVAKGDHSIAIGNESNVDADDGLAIGYQSKIKKGSLYEHGTSESIVLGNQSVIGADARLSTIIGSGSSIAGQAECSTIIGAKSSIAWNANSSTAVGEGTHVYKACGTALGAGSKVKGDYGTALGTNSSVTEDSDFGVAIGYASKADRAAGVPGYLADTDTTDITWKASIGAVSVGSSAAKYTRQITNVAAGTYDTDAVNVAQLKKVNSKADSATEMANKGWNLTTGVVTDATQVKPGDTVDFSGDKNISVSHKGTDVSIALKDTLTLGSNATDGYVTVDGVKGTVWAGHAVSAGNVNMDGDSGEITGLTNTTLNSKDFATTGRAATEEQLKLVKNQADSAATEASKHSKVVNGSNITVEETDQDGQKTYKVGLNKNLEGIESISNGDAKINLNDTGVVISKGKDKTFSITDTGMGMSVIGDDYVTRSIMVGKNGTVISGGLSVAGSKITNVAAGSEDTDAVNVGQLKEAVEAGNTDTHIKAGEYGVGTDNKVNMQLVDKNGKDAGTVTITDVAKASDVGDVNNIASDIKNQDGKTTVVDAVNNLNNKVGDLQYSKVEKGEIADGDSTTTAIGKLDQKLTDVAATAAKHTKVEGSSNITVTNTAKEGEAANYKVELKKDIEVNTVNANSVTTGQTVMNKDGLKVGEKVSVTENGLKVGDKVSVTENAVTAGQTSISDAGVKVGENTYISDKGLNANSNKITNVADGEENSDAVNYGQLKKSETTINNRIDGVENQVISNSNRINQLGDRVNKVGAGAAALAALHPLDFDPDDKWDFAAGYGNYNGENAAAIGAYYRPNEDTMFSVGGSFGNGENMVNAGVSLKLGQGNHVSTSKVAMAKEIKDLRKEMEGLKSALLDANAGKKLDTSKLQLFPDVPKNHWAYEYVSTLKGNGVLTGYPDGEFKGDRPMTRYEFATMLYKAMLEGATLSDKILKEFAPELERFTVDTVHQDKDGKPTVERVRTVKAEK